MAETLQENASGVLTSASPESKELDAESVTTVATAFLGRIGHKKGVEPKKVSYEEGVYTVEVEMKKFTATVLVDAQSHDIKEYDVQPKESESSLSGSPKTVLTMAGVSSIVMVGLYLVFKILGL